MTFTYDPNLADSVSWIRLQIGDTIEGSGPRLEAANYSDEELIALLAGTNPVGDAGKVVANIFGILTTEWTRMAISYTVGPRREELSRIADLYNKKAFEWGLIANTVGRAFSSGTYRAGGRDANSGVT